MEKTIIWELPRKVDATCPDFRVYKPRREYARDKFKCGKIKCF